MSESDHARFGGIGTTIGAALGGAVGAAPRADPAATAGLDVLFDRLLAQRRADPREDVLSSLAAVSDEGRVEPGEVGVLCRSLLVAGFETTVNLIGNAVMALLRHRERWEALVGDRSLAPGVVEEALRYDSPVQITGRWARWDTEVAGAGVRRGTQVMCLLGSANRDPAHFTDPDHFDVERAGAGGHLSFSSGAYYCSGPVGPVGG